MRIGFLKLSFYLAMRTADQRVADKVDQDEISVHESQESSVLGTKDCIESFVIVVVDGDGDGKTPSRYK